MSKINKFANSPNDDTEIECKIEEVIKPSVDTCKQCDDCGKIAGKIITMFGNDNTKFLNETHTVLSITQLVRQHAHGKCAYITPGDVMTLIRPTIDEAIRKYVQEIENEKIRQRKILEEQQLKKEQELINSFENIELDINDMKICIKEANERITCANSNIKNCNNEIARYNNEFKEFKSKNDKLEEENNKIKKDNDDIKKIIGRNMCTIKILKDKNNSYDHITKLNRVHYNKIELNESNIKRNNKEIQERESNDGWGGMQFCKRNIEKATNKKIENESLITSEKELIKEFNGKIKAYYDKYRERNRKLNVNNKKMKPECTKDHRPPESAPFLSWVKCSCGEVLYTIDKLEEFEQKGIVPIFGSGSSWWNEPDDNNSNNNDNDNDNNNSDNDSENDDSGEEEIRYIECSGSKCRMHKRDGHGIHCTSCYGSDDDY